MTQTLVTWPKYTLPEELRAPEKLPTPISFGDEWTIIAQGARPPAWFEILFAVVWTVMTLVLVLPMVAGMELFGLLFGIPFVLSGVFMWVGIVRKWLRYRRSKRFGSPILFLSQQSYRAGEILDLSFQRDLQTDDEVRQNGTLSARLVCVEVTRRTVGTDTTYDHTVHYGQELEPQPVFSGTHQLRGAWRATLPGRAQVSLLQKDHWLLWELQVRQHLEGQLDETTSFLIPVVP